MKKQGALCLLIAAFIFASGLVGFYIGRNTGRSAILVSSYTPQTQPPSSSVPESTTVPVTEPLLVNINTADLTELQKLPNIGPVLAQKIIDYRTQFGPFESVSQLTLVDGIGLATLEELLDYVTVGG